MQIKCSSCSRYAWSNDKGINFSNVSRFSHSSQWLGNIRLLPKKTIPRIVSLLRKWMKLRFRTSWWSIGLGNCIRTWSDDTPDLCIRSTLDFCGAMKEKALAKQQRTITILRENIVDNCTDNSYSRFRGYRRLSLGSLLRVAVMGSA